MRVQGQGLGSFGFILPAEFGVVGAGFKLGGSSVLLTRIIWVVVKIIVPFWIPIIIRHLIFRVHPKGIIILTTTHMSAYNLLRGLRGLAGTHKCGYNLGLQVP